MTHCNGAGTYADIRKIVLIDLVGSCVDIHGLYHIILNSTLCTCMQTHTLHSLYYIHVINLFCSYIKTEIILYIMYSMYVSSLTLTILWKSLIFNNKIITNSSKWNSALSHTHTHVDIWVMDKFYSEPSNPKSPQNCLWTATVIFI